MTTGKSPEEVEKLKELEAAIAKELDQKVTLAQPNDPRLDGSVALNPSLEAKPPEPSSIPINPVISKVDTVIIPQGATNSSASQPVMGLDKPINSDRKVEDITLEEVDALLNEVDEGFGGKLNELKSEVSQLQFSENMESLSISAEYLRDEKEEAEPETPAIDASGSVALTEDLFDTDEESIKGIKKSFWRHLRSIVTTVVLFPADLIWRASVHVWNSRKNPPKQILQEWGGAIKPVFTKRASIFEDFFEHLRAYTPIHYAKLVLFFLLVWALRYVALDIRHNIHPQEVKDPFLKSFDEVASDKKKMTEDVQDNKNVPIPDFVVSLPRLIATLHTDTPKKHPMVALEVFLEASDREAAVEIAHRRTELRDSIARILEQMTFAELDTIEGKDKLKLRIRLTTNKLLNNGRVKQVFFKSLQIHE